MDIKMNKPLFGGIALVCVALIGIGAFGLFQIYTGVPGTSALTTYVAWGLFIALFLFFEAVGCGALLAAAVGKADAALRIKLAIVGVVCSACAGLAIFPDLGRPLGMWRLFLSPNVASPLLLDVWLLSATLVFGVVLIAGLRFAKKGLTKVGTVGTGLFSVLLPLGTAVMFCSIPGKLGWESSAEIAIALVQVLFSALAAAVIFGSFAKERIGRYGRWAAILLVANAVLIVGEAMLLAYRNDVALQPLNAIMFGAFAPLFWLQAIGGIVVPASMLFFGKSSKIAMGLGVAGILISKYLYVVRGSIVPTYAEISESLSIPVLQPSTGLQMAPVYVPTMTEFMVAGALVGIAVLLILVAFNSRLLPSAEKVHVEKGNKAAQTMPAKQDAPSGDRIPVPVATVSN